MAIEQWTEGHKAVFTACRKILPIDNQLRSLHNEIRGGQGNILGREVVFEQYGPKIMQELGNDAGKLLADYLVRPAEHHILLNWSGDDSILNYIASVLAGVFCEQFPTQYSADALINRLKIIFRDPTGACEINTNPHGFTSDNIYTNRYLFPKANVSLRILSTHYQFEGVKDFIYATFKGDFNIRLDHGGEAYERFENTCTSLIRHEYLLFDNFTQILFSEGRLTYEWFEKAIILYPAFVRDYRISSDRHETREVGIESEFVEIYREFMIRVIDTQISLLPDSSRLLDQLIGYTSFNGIEWIRRGLECIESQSIKSKELKDDYDNYIGVFRNFICIEGLADGESEQDLVATLSSFSEQVLLLALPHAGYARNAILKALGWDDLLRLQQQLFNIAGGHPGVTNSLDDVTNCDSSTSGVIDRAAMLEVIQGLDVKRISKYFKALRASSLEIKNSIMLVTAVMGVEKEKIEKKLVRHGQAAIKAYGLYPVESGEELRERYLKFKSMHKEATKYGPERQANTQAAVKAGLKNLAQSAGYADETRLEWDMEADIVTNMVPLDDYYEVENWCIKLALEGINPRIHVVKQGKQLKSVPPKVRQSEIYKKMRESQDNIRAQARRFRKTLEDMMCNGEHISVDELKTLNRLPVVRSMLSQLIMISEDESFGLFKGGEVNLQGLNNELQPITGNTRIAHVYHLFQANVLPQWQKAIVEQRIVQPFKQAFRELYIVTPPEIEAPSHSRRFAGHVIDSSIASRLLQSRGWMQVGGDEIEVYKRFPAQNLIAEIGFPGVYHYLAGNATATIDEIYFLYKNEIQPLENIEPIIFSEVMRDVDLLASVAQVDGEDLRWSVELEQRRTELIATLFNELGLKQVACEGHFAYIEGKLASYKIHLGSGVIHIQPGNYLCIVPKMELNEQVYLPFADTDLRTSEIVSKIFLLLNDDKITDKSILSQIKMSSG